MHESPLPGSDLATSAVHALLIGLEPDEQTVAELARNAHTGPNLTRIWRQSPDDRVRWAAVYLAAQTGHPSVIPLLIEASAHGATSNDYARSASRIAGATLTRMVTPSAWLESSTMSGSGATAFGA